MQNTVAPFTSYSVQQNHLKSPCYCGTLTLDYEDLYIPSLDAELWFRAEINVREDNVGDLTFAVDELYKYDDTPGYTPWANATEGQRIIRRAITSYLEAPDNHANLCASAQEYGLVMHKELR